MVKSSAAVLVLVLVGLVCISVVPGVVAQRQYFFGQEWAQIWVNSDGSVDLFYNVSLTLDSGEDINWVSIGQPYRDFTIGSAEDQYGNMLETDDVSSGGDYKVRIDFNSALQAGDAVWFTLVTNVAHMIYDDATNPGNDGMQFTLSWFSEAVVEDARVLIVLPPGVSEGDVKTGEVLWSNIQYEGDRLAVYFEKQDLLPDERFTIGISYPKQEGWVSFSGGTDGFGSFLGDFWLLFFVAIAVLFAIVAIVVVYFVLKRPYKRPTMAIECLGIVRGLTAVEASYLLDLEPPQIVTEVLYSVLKKRAVWVEGTSPSLRFRILKPFLDRTGTKERPLRYYEIDFLNSIVGDGSLDEEKLASMIMEVQSTVEEKLKGYCRRDTIDYYRKIVEKAWGQVEAAGTAQLTSQAYDEQLLWLFLDPKASDRTKTVFTDRVFMPDPVWFWYWYSYRYYSPNPVYRPNVGAPAQGQNPPTIPGADFANNIATAIEQSANNFVVNLEKFANSIVPMSGDKSSKQPVHQKAKCVCACAACACACACVSCACACAGGGVG